LFRHRELVNSRESFDRETADDFWEVGASGSVYDRDTVRREILARLEDQPEDEMVSEDWCTEEHRVRELAADTYLFTYVLHGQGRAPAWGDRAARFLVPADRVAGGVGQTRAVKRLPVLTMVTG
jgi:hypothetical protein